MGLFTVMTVYGYVTGHFSNELCVWNGISKHGISKDEIVVPDVKFIPVSCGLCLQ